MKKDIIKSIFLGSLLVLVLCICNIPIFPGIPVMAIYSVLVILFGIFAVSMWVEKADDEREMQHIALSSRVAFTLGSLVLVVAIVYQGLQTQEVNQWITTALAAMIIGKVGGRIWAHYRH